MNLYSRVAAISDFVFVPKVLVHYRGHDRSETQLINDTGHGVAWYSVMAERVDAIAYLLRSSRAARASYRNWLAERLLDAHCNQSVAIHPCVPQMWHSWDDCRAIALDHLERVIPKGEAVVLIDDEQLGIGDTFNGRRVIPFLERDGEYYGPPDNDAQGIEQLEHLPSEVRWLAIAWSSFWWLDHYGQLHRHLEKQAACRAVTPYIRIYELVQKPHVKFTYHRRAADAKPAELPAPGAR